MDILHIKIDNFSLLEIRQKIVNFLRSASSLLIVTPNPEMLVDAEYDWFFKEALNKADFAVADGFGLVCAARYLYKKKLQRLAGVDLMLMICDLAARENKSVYLVGGEEGIAEKAVEKLREKYLGLKVVGAEKGIVFGCHPERAKRSEGSRFFGSASWRRPQNDSYLVGLDFDVEENNKLLQRIRAAGPDIIFVAFGHNKQEKWLAEFLPQLPSVKIGMGVGGAFDYLSGRVRRAPTFLRRVGLEWLWRLLRQPWRLPRIWRATATFCRLVRDYKIQLSLPYRQGVIGFIINQKGEWFIALRRQALSDSYFHNLPHWQPPQGGIDKDETPEQAVLREVKEEIGLETSIIYHCRQKHQYDWSVDFMRKKGRGYHFRGQQKHIFLLQYKGALEAVRLDKKELEDYRWVSLSELKQLINPLRKESLEILLEERKDVNVNEERR